MKIPALCIIVVTALLAGCASPQAIQAEQRRQYLAIAPNIDADTKAAILEGKIKVGMDASQIKASWGESVKTERSDGPNGAEDVWIYGYSDYYFNFVPTTYIYFSDAVVTDWQSR